jgi:predicted peptidase
MPAPPTLSLATLVLFTLAVASRAEGDAPVAGRYVTHSVKVRHERHTYAMWLPPGFDDATRRWPAIVFLHGSGECGTDPLAPTRVGIGAALAAHPERWPCVVVFPQKPRQDEEWEEREDLVLGVLDDATKHGAIDPARIALTGISQGGHGVWMIGARHPERFTCLVAVCGYGRDRTVSSRVARKPVWAFHGLKDDVVDPGDTRRIVNGIRAERRRLGLDSTAVRMTLYPDANHDSWDPAFAEEALPGWILAQPPAR